MFSEASQQNKQYDFDRGMVALGASFLFGKAKYALVALKFTKFVPLASMLVSSFAYSFFFGWPFAVGMVGLIAVHESGHAMAMRYYGVPFSPAVFIPFMGAVISMKEQPRKVLDEAVIALAGPIVGSAGAGALAVLGAMTDSQLCMVGPAESLPASPTLTVSYIMIFPVLIG